MTETYDHLIDDWRSWTGILNDTQAKELVRTWAKRPYNQQGETEDMAKSIYNVTVPATINGVIEASDDKDAAEKFCALAKAIFGDMFGVVSIVGDPKVIQVASGGKTKAPVKSSSDDDDEDDEDEDDEDEDDEGEDDEDEDDEDEDEDDEDDKKTSKKSSKSDKKSDKKSDDGKKKIKIKLKS